MPRTVASKNFFSSGRWRSISSRGRRHADKRQINFIGNVEKILQAGAPRQHHALRTEQRRVDLALFQLLQPNVLVANCEHFGIFFRVDLVFSKNQSRQHVGAGAGSVDPTILPRKSATDLICGFTTNESIRRVEK